MGMDDSSAAVTDENGAFTLLAAAGVRGRFVVDAFADDWVPVSSAILGSGAVGNTGAGSGDTSYQDIQVGLKLRGARLSGLVTSSSGQALGGVVIRAEVCTTPARVAEGSESGPRAGGMPDGVLVRPFSRIFTKVVETGQRGNYEIRGLPEGALTVSARRIGEKPVVRTLRSVDGATLTANFMLGDMAGTTRTPRPTYVATVPVPPRCAGSVLIGLIALVLICPVRAESDGTATRVTGWERVESLHQGRPMRLILFKSASFQVSRKIKGVFASATGSSVTIMLGNGQTRTVERQAIQAIRVSRPARRRYGWIPGAAVFIGALAYMLNAPGTRDLGSGRVGTPAVISAPAWIGG